MINLSQLNFSFSKKPLLIGGKAMEYYGLRKSGLDIDLVVCKKDFERLVKKHPQQLKDLCGDLGVVVSSFEIWKTITYFDYDYLKENAIEKDSYLIISLEKLLTQKAMGMEKEKYLNDLRLIVKKIQADQLKKFKQIELENQSILNGIKDIRYVERKK